MFAEFIFMCMPKGRWMNILGLSVLSVTVKCLEQCSCFVSFSDVEFYKDLLLDSYDTTFVAAGSG